MGEAVNVLASIKQPDLVSPLQVAMKLFDPNSEAKTQRMFAENQAMRDSAKAYRDEQEFKEKQDDKRRTDAIENAHIFQTIGMLHPTNPGAANMLADAIGMPISPVQNPLTATTPAANEPSFDEQFNSALGAGAPSSDHAGPAGYPAPAEPVYEGPQESPDLEERAQSRGATPDPKLEALMSSAAPKFEGATYEAPKPEPSNPLFEAVVGTHHYPLPTVSPGTGLGEKYDKLYQSLVQRGTSPDAAQKYVEGLFSKDNEAGNIATRMADEISKREAAKEQYGEKFAPSADQRQQNFVTAEKGRNARNAANNEARKEVGALQSGPRQEQADTGKRTQYMGVVKEYVNRVGANKDIGVLKNLSKIKGELSPDSSLSTQVAAADTLAQIAQGGKASQAVMNAFNNHSLGPAQTAYDKFYQAGHNGRHSPAWIESKNQTVRDLKNTYDDIVSNEANSFEDAAGNRSAYAADPEVGPHVQEQRRTFYQTLGMKAPENGPSDAEKLQQILDHLEIK